MAESEPLPVGRLDRRVKRSEVMTRYALSNTSLYRAIKKKAFPKPHRLPGGHGTFWWESQLVEYEQLFK